MAGRRPNKRTYYQLFFAQVIALVSTGVATVALALLAYPLAGADAGAVMGTALAIKMLAYVAIALVAAALTERVARACELAPGLAFVAFGAGSVAGAIAVLKYVPRPCCRRTMLAGCGLAAIGLLLGLVLPRYLTLLALWVVLGLGCALAVTPAGSLLLQSAAPADRQPAYAAQFALSHAGLLLTYPLAGWLGAAAGMPVTFGVFGLLAGLALLAA